MSIDEKERLLLGVDVGGTGCKTAVYTLDGEMLGEGYSEYGLLSNAPGQAEVDANDWWQGAIDSIREALAGLDAERVGAVGVGCTNGFVPVDRDARPLHPAIMLWDQRAVAEVDRICEVLGREEIERVTGNPAAPGAYGLPTIQWFKENRPELFAATHKFLVPGGFIVAQLTGNLTIDLSRACTTQLFDIRRQQWHEPFFQKLGIPLDKMPELLPSTAVAGTVTAEAAAATGLPAGIPVAAGITDTIGADIGANCMSPGETLIIMGTAARVTMIMEEPQFDRRFMNFVSVEPGRWVGLGAINGVGSALRWLRDVLAIEEQQAAAGGDDDVYDLITAHAAQAPPGAEGLILLPYLAGERTPIWDPRARGLLFGLTISHERSHIYRAFLEGPAFSIRQAVEIIAEKEQPPLERITIGGAAAKSAVWNKIIASVLGRPLQVLSGTHVEVLGAAVVGGLAAGLFPDLRTAMERVAQPTTQVEPDAEMHRIYNELYPLFVDLYPQVAGLYERLGGVELPGRLEIGD